MLCPACLMYAQETEAETTVNGTQYCRSHGVNALEMSQDPRMRRGRNFPALPPLPPQVPPAPPE